MRVSYETEVCLRMEDTPEAKTSNLVGDMIRDNSPYPSDVSDSDVDARESFAEAEASKVGNTRDCRAVPQTRYVRTRRLGRSDLIYLGRKTRFAVKHDHRTPSICLLARFFVVFGAATCFVRRKLFPGTALFARLV